MTAMGGITDKPEGKLERLLVPIACSRGTVGKRTRATLLETVGEGNYIHLGGASRFCRKAVNPPNSPRPATCEYPAGWHTAR